MKDEKHYFSPILDCFNNELIAYGLSRRPNGMLVQEMLLQAVEKLPRNIIFRPRNPLSNAELSTPISEK